MSTRAKTRSEAPSAAPPEDAASWTGGSLESLAAWLRAHGVDPAAFASASNDAKSLSELAREVARGETSLVANEMHEDATMTKTRKLAERRVRVLRLLIRDKHGRVLIEARQEWSDGRVRERGTPLSEKLMRDEDWRDAAFRAVSEELGSCLVTKKTTDSFVDRRGDDDASCVSSSRLVTLDESSVTFSSIDRTSVSYPGLRCAYEFITVDAEVLGLPECDGRFVAGATTTTTKKENGDDDADAGEPSFTSTEINSDGTTLVATWVWREGYVVDDV
jgi:hypothetical protein